MNLVIEDRELEMTSQPTSTSIALVPGSFDPITLGHLDIITRTSQIFNQVIVVVTNNYSKQYMFDLTIRDVMVQQAVASLANVQVITSNELLVTTYLHTQACCVVRGIRNNQDYEYEHNLERINQSLYHELLQDPKLARQAVTYNYHCLYLASNPQYQFISSSMVREFLRNQEIRAHVANYVPNNIVSLLLQYIL